MIKLNPIEYDVLRILAEDIKRQYFSTRQEAGVDLRQTLKSRGYEEKKTAYSIQKLRRYGLIENTRRGVYKISIKGRHVLTERRTEIKELQDRKYTPEKTLEKLKNKKKKLETKLKVQEGRMKNLESSSKSGKKAVKDYNETLEKLDKIDMDIETLEKGGKTTPKIEEPKDEVPRSMGELRPVEYMTVNEIRSELNDVRKALKDKVRPSYDVRQIYRNRINELSNELNKRKKDESIEAILQKEGKISMM